jgi:hypothetical protein
MVEGQVEGLEAEFKSIVANAVGLFERVKLFVKEIGVMLEGLLGGAGNLKWYKDGVEAEEAFLYDKVVMVAEAEDLEDGTEVQVLLYEKDYTGENDYLKTFDAEVRDNKISVEWEVEYHEDKDDVKTDEENASLIPEYVFVVKSEKHNIKEESSVLNLLDWREFTFQDSETGDPLADVEYIIHYPDGTEETGNLDNEGKMKIENVKFKNFEITLKNDDVIVI